MRTSFVIGRVAKKKEGTPRVFIDENKNRAAVTLYCGTQYNADASAPKVHLSVTAWYNFATDKIKSLKADDVVMISGTLSNKKNKNGVHDVSIQADDNNLTLLGEQHQAGWGIYTKYQEMGYVSGVFLTNTGYNVNIRTRYYKPYFKSKGNGSYEKVTAYDERQLSYQVSPKSRAFKAINAFVGKLTGADIGEQQASKEQLEVLKNFFVVVEDGFTKFSDKTVDVNGSNQTSLFANSFANNVMFIFKHQKAGDGQKVNNQAAPSGVIPPGPPPEAYENDVPFPDLAGEQDFEQPIGFP